jgi:hypothetical protein
MEKVEQHVLILSKSLCACLCLFIYIFFLLKLLKISARLFPLAGGGNTPTSPSILLNGFQSFLDDNEFVILHSPNSPTGFHENNTGFDDDKISVIIEDEETNDDIPHRPRQNSTPTSFSTLKTALLNGILAEKTNK